MIPKSTGLGPVNRIWQALVRTVRILVGNPCCAYCSDIDYTAADARQRGWRYDADHDDGEPDWTCADCLAVPEARKGGKP